MRIIEKPKEGEYPPYAIIYLDQVPDDGDLIGCLENNAGVIKELFLSLGEDQVNYRYAPGKWTPKDILAHIIDDERVFAYRALRFARNDRTPLPGVDQDRDAENAGANGRHITDLVDEYAKVRSATVALFNSFGDDVFKRKGEASGYTVSVAALGYLIAGHELHHVKIIRERYL
jgi:hypothetical protein